MSHVTRQPIVENDLIEIWLYIAKDNIKAADRVFDAVEATFQKIAQAPGIGTEYQSMHPELNGVRYFPVTRYQNYLIFYRPLENGIEVIRVLRRSRDIENIL